MRVRRARRLTRALKGPLLGLLLACAAGGPVLLGPSPALARAQSTTPPAAVETAQAPTEDTAGTAFAPNVRVDLALGVAGQPVAEAWNPLRVELRDAPPATLTLHVDQGTLRTGEVPLTVTLDVRGGAGLTIFEELIYLPHFASLSWRLATPERVIASGSVAGREADERPLDLLLTSTPGVYRVPFQEAFGPGARLVDVVATLLPQDVAAYDGVRSLTIDGSAAAPRLEAVAAAAAAGVVVVLAGPLPPSHSELLLLLHGADAARLGSGALVSSDGGVTTAVEALSQALAQAPNQAALRAALLEQPLVEPPPQLKETILVLMAAAYAVLTLLLLRFGTPGLSASLVLAGLVALIGWQLLRPPVPQLQAGAVLAVAGGDLALLRPATEVLTLPRTTLTLPTRNRPVRPQAYWVDKDGSHFGLERWRALLLEQPAALAPAQLVVVDGAPRNLGPGTLYDLYLVGEGARGSLLAGSSTLQPGEEGAAGWVETLAPLLPSGTWLARGECGASCTTWVVYPPMAFAAARDEQPGQSLPRTDPFRSTPAALPEEL